METPWVRPTPETESFDDFARGVPEIQKAVFEEWNLKGTGPLATNGIEAGVKSRPSEEELEEMKKYPTPDFVTEGVGAQGCLEPWTAVTASTSVKFTALSAVLQFFLAPRVLANSLCLSKKGVLPEARWGRLKEPG